MLKAFKRYSGVSAMILLCFFSAFVALCNGLLSTAKASDMIRTENQYAYLNELKLTIRNSEISSDKLMEIADCVDHCNVYLDTKMNSSLLIYFKEIEGSYAPDVILKQNEALSLPTSKSITHIPDNGIIVSSNITADELTIHGIKLRVIEKMDHEKYPFITYLLAMNGSDYFNALPNVLDGQKEITLCVFSNKYDVGETGSRIKEKIAEIIPEAVVTARITNTQNDIFQSSLSTENIISAGLFLFALINTIIISYYWVVVRRREIAVRKAFGAGNFRIIGLVTAELLSLVGISAVLALLTQIIIWRIQGGEIELIDSAVLAVGLLLAITLAVIIAMIVPVWFILHIQPSEGVKL